MRTGTNRILRFRRKRPGLTTREIHQPQVLVLPSLFREWILMIWAISAPGPFPEVDGFVPHFQHVSLIICYPRWGTARNNNARWKFRRPLFHIWGTSAQHILTVHSG